MKKIDVSVVMAATRTVEEYFEAAVMSILDQDFYNFEFIIVDDCLSKENRDFLEHIDDSRIIILSNETNLGQSRSVNKALSVASGKYIVRMDSDDIALSDRLSVQVEYMEQHPECLACGGFAETTDQHRIIPSDYPDSISRKVGFLFSCDMVHPTMVIRREAITKYGLHYDEKQLYAQDYMMWIDVMRFGDIGMASSSVLKYRIHAGQISSQKSKMQEFYAVRAQKKCFELFGFDENSIDLIFHNELIKHGLNAPLSKIKCHLNGLISQASMCMSATIKESFLKELNYRMLKAGIRELVYKGNTKNGLYFILSCGRKIKYWRYYIVRSKTPHKISSDRSLNASI